MKQSEIFNAWKLAIKRSQKSYELYKISSIYLCALRIYSANKRVYKLTERLYENESEYDDILLKLLWHLDDWFKHFDMFERNMSPNLEDNFIFESVKGAFNYPINEIRKILES